MARTRSRSFRLCPQGRSRRSWHDASTGESGVDEDFVALPRYNLQQETIIDEINQKRDRLAQAKLKRAISIAKRQPDSLIAKSVIADLYANQMQVHPCTHVKKEIHEFSGVAWNTAIVGTPYSYVRQFSHHEAFRRLSFSGFTHANGLLDIWNGLSRTGYISSAFHSHDWFALLTKWHETCDNLIPSSSLVGESMIEHDIFVDAFKLIINPSSVLKQFIRFATQYKKKKTTLGKMKRMLSTAANAHLYTTFGVGPAIDEIVNVFEAHKKVSSRLQFLKENKGGYVPIRVRQDLPSTISNTLSENNFGVICESKFSTGVISAQGKVRTDLDYAGAWKAYLQYFGLHKFIGLAWELIPFSFVIDWVTNAGEYVQKYTSPNFASPFYNIRHISHSVKTTLVEAYQVPKSYQFTDGDRLFETKPPIISRLTSTNYTRYPGLPETAGRVDFSQLGTFHALISGSLLIQRLKW